MCKRMAEEQKLHKKSIKFLKLIEIKLHIRPWFSLNLEENIIIELSTGL